MEVNHHDIVLVGGGGAGLRAAIAAVEANPGLSVACVSKLYPMRKPAFTDPRLTDDHFLLAIRQTDADLHPDMAKELFLEHGAIEVHEIPQEDAR